MIAAGLIALTLAGTPALHVQPIAARYYPRRKRRAAAAPAAEPHAIVIEEQPPRRVRVIPIISFDEFYRRVGL